jgi:hypothetical protein
VCTCFVLITTMFETVEKTLECRKHPTQACCICLRVFVLTKHMHTHLW